MPKITLEVSKLQKQAIEALAEHDGVTVDHLFAPWVRDLTNNRGGIDPADTEADQQARVDKLTAREIDQPFDIGNSAGSAIVLGGAAALKRPAKFTGAIQDSTGTQRMSSTGVFALAATSTIDSQTLQKRSFACIYKTGSDVAQSIPTGSTYTKVTPFTDNLTGNVLSTPSAANDNIVVGRTGVYQVDFSRSYSTGTANVTWTVAVFVNGTVAAQTIQQVKLGNTNTPAYATLAVHVNANANDTIDVRLYHDNGGSVNLTYHYAALSITAID